MCEILWNILIVFFLSSIFLGFQTVIFIKNNSNIVISNKNFLNLVCLVSFIHAILIQFIPQFLIPIVCFLLIITIFTVKFNISIKSCIILIIKLVFILLVVDAICVFIYDNIFFIDVTNMELNFYNIIISLPAKIIETFVVILFKKR